MLTRWTCRKIVGWSGFVLLLLLAAYWSSYYRMVQVIQTTTLRETADGRIVERRVRPYYRLPWPFSTNVSHPQLRPKVETLFRPANAFDRWVRPEMWASKEVELVQSDASANSLPNPQ